MVETQFPTALGISFKASTQPPAPNSGGSEIKVPRIGDLGASAWVIFLPETALAPIRL